MSLGVRQPGRVVLVRLNAPVARPREMTYQGKWQDATFWIETRPQCARREVALGFPRAWCACLKRKKLADHHLNEVIAT